MERTAAVDRLLQSIGPAESAIQQEMAERARSEGFPIIGAISGKFLAMIAASTQAERIFEFGSGFGYSATWFCNGLDAAGEIILTEIDADELTDARTYLERAGVADRARFEQGDAIEIIDQVDGPIDIVLIDHAKAQYPAAFEKVISKVPPGGVLIADNIIRGPADPETIAPYLDETDELPENDAAAGIVQYLRTVQQHPDTTSIILPIGKGLAVTARL